MFKNAGAFASYSVTDIKAAKSFYADTLELGSDIVKENEMGFLELSFPSELHVLLYSKPNHEPATFTVLNFPVKDINAAADWLLMKGISFERYEGMNLDEKGISRGQGPTIAWFKDPFGNIISVIEEK